MDGPRQNSEYCFCLSECSFKRCCCCLLIFLVFIVVAVGVAILIVIFLLKPEKPFFSFQTVKLDWYELDAYSGSVLFVSSVMTLTLNAQNPNKVGLRYSPSRLNVYYEGVPIGVIRVPGFFQPAHSNNVSVRTRVLFHSVNVTQLVAGASLQDGSRKDIIQMNILGDVRVQLLVFDMNFLKIKVALDCDINIDYKELALESEVYITRVVQKHFASFPPNSKFIFMKCALAFYA
ncbi:NDR1/HIN1-like protein 10 [Alnus glutinosa]|uniref:NDR1/HIN1-like protein 10 n=1 Tax=Alnus glutinosa TaxID=3517 RepID=UPI002D78EDEE|nr:NDR1/HIN1-like protein 10 [Alnus glutinosa]